MRLRSVYEIWSRDKKQVYVGLSVNSTKRAVQHKYSKSAGGLLNDGGNLKVVAPSLCESEAVQLERDLIAKYRADSRVKCLNRRAGGQLGSDGGLKWTKERVYEIAKGCKTRAEFYYKNGSAYQAARRDGYFDDICREFGIADNPYKTRLSKQSVKAEFDRVASVYDMEKSHYRYMVVNGLWSEFAELTEVRSDSVPDDFDKILKYFPKDRDTSNSKWHKDPYEYDTHSNPVEDYMIGLLYHGQYLDTCKMIKNEHTKEICDKAGVRWIEVEENLEYPTKQISLQRDFPTNCTTIELAMYQHKWIKNNPNYFRKRWEIINALRQLNHPKLVDQAISNGKLPTPTHHHYTGAIFHIDAIVKWALDTPRNA